MQDRADGNAVDNDGIALYLSAIAGMVYSCYFQLLHIRGIDLAKHGVMVSARATRYSRQSLPEAVRVLML